MKKTTIHFSKFDSKDVGLYGIQYERPINEQQISHGQFFYTDEQKRDKELQLLQQHAQNFAYFTRFTKRYQLPDF